MSGHAKNLTSEQLTVFLKEFLSKFTGFNGHTVTEESNVVVFSTSEASKLLAEINSKIGIELSDYIDKVLKENAKLYNRSITFYESEETPNSLILRWI
jgi:hypothetical protein